MRRLAQLIVVAIAGFAAWFYLRPADEKNLPGADVWVGSQESGCMYPVAMVMDGKDPEWFRTSRPLWNQFESKSAAKQAGYRECP